MFKKYKRVRASENQMKTKRASEKQSASYRGCPSPFLKPSLSCKRLVYLLRVYYPCVIKKCQHQTARVSNIIRNFIFMTNAGSHKRLINLNIQI